MPTQIHSSQPVLELGPAPGEAERILILLHGRGATAESMLPLAEALRIPGTRCLIPQAAGNRWYPQTAFGPLEENEPELSAALGLIGDLISSAEDKGYPRSRIILGGFSQGACLAVEYAARNPGRYGGLLVFSGALIGPPEKDRKPAGDLGGTPVLIGGSEADPWIPLDLLAKTARIIEKIGGQVDLQIYPDPGHAIRQDQVSRAVELIKTVKSGDTAR